MFNFNFFKSTPVNDQTPIEGTWNPNTVTMQPISPAAPSSNQAVVSEQPVCAISFLIQPQEPKLTLVASRLAKSKCSCAEVAPVVVAAECKIFIAPGYTVYRSRISGLRKQRKKI
jgi:hypothetical protein